MAVSMWKPQISALSRRLHTYAVHPVDVQPTFPQLSILSPVHSFMTTSILRRNA